ncbi:MAG: hypothetical protein KGS45_01705 [Planctomycetes bacterium]|nr:hypothetical protein [Planctomycetota bacterium]
MGIQDRRYDQNESGGGGGGLGSRFGAGGFFDWSLPLFRVPRNVPGIGGIAVRLHILYIIIAISELFSANKYGPQWLQYSAVMMGVLFLLVLLHEFGHCLACRVVGGSADQILMWPLGGLATCSPPHRWKAAFITTIGGPGVNAILAPVFGVALLLAGVGWSEVIFNPFAPGDAARNVRELGGMKLIWLWSAHYMNLMLLAFNVLLPMFPMDGGRIVQELLWWRMGHRRSMTISVNLGLICAIVVGVYSIVSGQMRLLGVALFAGITCYGMKQQVAMMQDEPAWAYNTDKGYGGFQDEPSEPSWFEKRKIKAAQQRKSELNAEVDRILEKIRKEGMGALTSKERAILQEASKSNR